MNSSILLPFLPGSSLSPQSSLEQACRRREQSFSRSR